MPLGIQPTLVPIPTLPQERANLDGVLLAALACGALLMLYAQLVQVLLSRPERGKKFWAIVAYSSFLYPLATVAIAGMLKFTEITYIDHRSEPNGPGYWHNSNGGNHINVMGQICITLVPWFGDILMLYRLFVIWNSRWWITPLPGLLYISRVAMSVPLLIAETRTDDPGWTSKTDLYSTAFHAICVAFNLFTSIAISVRLLMMRRLMREVMGNLHASFYTGTVTILVESGAFFTAWAVTYIILSACDNNMKDVFLLPYTHVLSITRMLIVLRMAQDRAWSHELVSSITTGVLDWQVSTTHSLPLYDVPPSTGSARNLTRKLGNDSGSAV